MALICAGTLLGACASLQTKPEDAVTQRANARWQALVKGDMAKAYAYSTPGFRAVVDVEGFKGRTGIAGRWLGAQVTSVSCDTPERCKAIIRLEFSTLMPGFSKDRMTTHIDETWLLEDGQWWIFQKV
jgi:hypothetical protein